MWEWGGPLSNFAIHADCFMRSVTSTTKRAHAGIAHEVVSLAYMWSPLHMSYYIFKPWFINYISNACEYFQGGCELILRN